MNIVPSGVSEGLTAPVQLNDSLTLFINTAIKYANARHSGERRNPDLDWMADTAPA
jgi:hypothetical protein